MKAITVWNPWAYLIWLKGHSDPEIAKLGKGIETRGWPTPYRGPLAIHAAKNFPREARSLCLAEPFLTALTSAGLQGTNELPRGAVIATCELVNCWHIVAHPGTNVDVAKNIPIGAESMTTDKHAPDFADYFVPTKQEILFGDWRPGRYAWELANIKPLPEPIPARGMQGLWNWEVSEGVKL